MAVVTGAARGIGRAVAETLLQVGWHCALTHVRADLEETTRELDPDGSKSLARETARAGLNVNCVCPGPTETPLVQEMRDDPETTRSPQS